VGYAARSFLASAELGRPLQAAEYISPAYVYNKAKQHSGCALGLPMQAALELLKKEGASTLSQFPYGPNWCDAALPASAAAEAPRYRIYEWEAIDHGAVGKTAVPEDWREPIVIDDIKGQLWKGFPVVFGMKIPSDFFYLKNFTGTYKSTAVLDKNNITSRDNMHAMTLVGYDNDRQAFRILNSWGEGWADKGYAWIDYDTFKRLVSEAYVMRPANTPPPPPAPVPPPNVPPEMRLKQALSKVECGRLDVTMRDGKRMVTGFGGSQEELATLRQRAQAIDPAVGWEVRHRPWPQCETELILDAAAPKPGAQLRTAMEGGAELTGDTISLKADDIFTIEAETTADRPFLHVVYVQADGSAVELYRGTPQPDANGRRRQVVGASGTKDVRFQVAPPFGHELIVTVASDKPLFGAGLENYATEREFLTALQTALVRARTAGSPVSAAIRRVNTRGT
jgi:hypothetical protein